MAFWLGFIRVYVGVDGFVEKRRWAVPNFLRIKVIHLLFCITQGGLVFHHMLDALWEWNNIAYRARIGRDKRYHVFADIHRKLSTNTSTVSTIIHRSIKSSYESSVSL